MLILPGPVKIDLLFGQSRAVSPPWRVTAGTLRGIDNHFWDWILWLCSKQLGGQNEDLITAELAKLHQHLLGPLGVTAVPATIAQAICDYRAARDERESEFAHQIPRTTEHAIIPALHGLLSLDVP